MKYLGAVRQTAGSTRRNLGVIFMLKIGQQIRPKTVVSPVGGYTPKNNLMPVSYTHLDVYKRQIMGNNYFYFDYR